MQQTGNGKELQTSSYMIKSKLSVTQKSQISSIDSQKLEYEELLIKFDEQEKQLFQLSELKNRLQRQKQKMIINKEISHQKQMNTIHIGYAIIIFIICFMIGIFSKT